jgi:membrane protein DedA with SNARE-associated domain
VNPPLPGIFGTLAPVLGSYGYLAVAGFILLEDFGVPVPGETILIAASVYAGAGRLNVVLVAVIAFVAAAAGDNLGYAIGYFGGRRLVVRWGRYVGLTERRVDHVERIVRRHGPWVVVVARFVEGLRQANGILAGVAAMPWTRRFLPANLVGAALWVGVWTAVGVLAGNHIDTIYQEFRRYGLYVLIGVAVLVAVLVARAVLIRRRRGGGGS